MKNFSSLILLLIVIQSNAQYYYKDLLATTDINEKMKIYILNNVHKVIATGYTSNGTATSNFNETQESDFKNKQLLITTVLNQNTNRIIFKFDENGRLQNLNDSSTGMISNSVYAYDVSGKLVEISNTIKDSSQDFSQTESHFWMYKNNSPEKMWRIINMTDSLEVRFKSDVSGNIIEEQNFRKAYRFIYFLNFISLNIASTLMPL